MIRNYIFDLYGTLVDIRTEEAMPALWRRMALLYSFQGADYGPEELRQGYRAAVEAQIERRAVDHPAILKDHIEPEILDVFRTLSMRHLRLYPQAAAVLKELRNRGQGVYLLSNAQAAFTVPELNKLGLASLFDGVVLSSDVGIKKPDSALFRHILQRYGLDPAECLMIGNDGEADMWGAAAVGMAGRYIHTKQSPARPDRLPETCREIDSLRDLL